MCLNVVKQVIIIFLNKKKTVNSRFIGKVIQKLPKLGGVFFISLRELNWNFTTQTLKKMKHQILFNKIFSRAKRIMRSRDIRVGRKSRFSQNIDDKTFFMIKFCNLMFIISYFIQFVWKFLLILWILCFFFLQNCNLQASPELR